MLSTEAIVALSGLVGVVSTSAIAALKIQLERRRLDQAQRELRFQRHALGFPEFVSEWGIIHDELMTLMEDTEIDRILMLRAWNGHLEPRWTTAVFQMRVNGHAPVSYVHFELDDDYVRRVRDIVQRGPVSLTTADLPPGRTKDIYEAEGITASVWAHLDSFRTQDGEGKAIAYCSFSTHSDTGISPSTVTRCNIIVSRLKGLAANFDRCGDKK